MIPAKHKKRWVWFWNQFAVRAMHYHFREVQCIHALELAERPVLLLGNHTSWWDGFFGLYLNQKIFKKCFHAMMLEEQLSKRMSFSHAGAFSIQKESRSMVHSLKYAGERLKDKENLVCIFPEGEITSAYTRPLYFQRGVLKVMQYAQFDFQLVFVAALTDYGPFPKPTLNFYLTAHNPLQVQTLEDLEKAYNAFYTQAVHQQRQWVHQL